MHAFARIEAARGPVALTFFEYNTLAALLLFEAARLDVWVLEIGMGGRLDAVNVIDADVAVVVSIGFDHTDYLGATLEAIGREKAGVFRRGRPAVLGSRSLPPVVADTARSLGAVCKRLGQEFDVARSSAVAASRWAYRGPRWRLDDLPAPRLRGDVQYDNAATALAALEELEARLPIQAAQIAAGLESVQLIGRFQVIVRPGAPSFILDVAHNPDAARVLAANLADQPAAGRSFAVCGILADKDAAEIVAALRGCIDAWWFVPTSGERGRSAAALADTVAGALAAPATECSDLAAGCAAALAAASSADRIVVFGSFHVVGPALDWLEAQGWLEAPRWHEAERWHTC
jgi:dihydrofolate synthase/folylpolyglutamate synthase